MCIYGWPPVSNRKRRSKWEIIIWVHVKCFVLLTLTTC